MDDGSREIIQLEYVGPDKYREPNTLAKDTQKAYVYMTIDAIDITNR